MFQKTTLSNNLRIITAPMKETKAITLYLVIKTGSRYETPLQSGISHFLEHLFFKGTKKRPSTLAISRELDGIGAGYNAFTSEEMTGFYIQAEASKLPLLADILYDILQNSTFSEKEIEREKGVIIEEINLRQDTPIAYIFDLYKTLLYDDTPLGRPVIGAPKIIQKIRRQSFFDYKNYFYVPDNMVLGMAGKIGERDEYLIKSSFQKISGRPVGCPLPYQDKQTKPEILLHFKKTDQAHLILGFKSISRHSPLRYAQEVLNIILGGSMSSRLFTEIREKRGLCYYISSDSWYFQDTGSLLAATGVPLAKTKTAIQLILKEFLKIREKGIRSSELKRAKDNLRGRMALRLESSYHRAAYLADQQLLLDEIKTPEQELKEIEKVSQDDIMELAKKEIKPEKLNLAIIGPFKEKKRFEKIIRIF